MASLPHRSRTLLHNVRLQDHCPSRAELVKLGLESVSLRASTSTGSTRERNEEGCTRTEPSPRKEPATFGRTGGDGGRMKGSSSLGAVAAMDRLGWEIVWLESDVEGVAAVLLATIGGKREIQLTGRFGSQIGGSRPATLAENASLSRRCWLGAC